jgi:hypothetical protein
MMLDVCATIKLRDRKGVEMRDTRDIGQDKRNGKEMIQLREEVKSGKGKTRYLKDGVSGLDAHT